MAGDNYQVVLQAVLEQASFQKIKAELENMGKVTSIKFEVDKDGKISSAIAQVQDKLKNINTVALSLNQTTGNWSRGLISVLEPLQKIEDVENKISISQQEANAKQIQMLQEYNVKLDEQDAKKMASIQKEQIAIQEANAKQNLLLQQDIEKQNQLDTKAQSRGDALNVQGVQDAELAKLKEKQKLEENIHVSEDAAYKKNATFDLKRKTTIEQYSNSLKDLQTMHKKAFADPEVQQAATKLNTTIEGIGKNEVLTAEKSAQLSSELGAVKSKIGEVEQVGEEGVGGFISDFVTAIEKTVVWAGAMTLLYGTMRQFEEAVQYLKDLNVELVRTQMVTGQTVEQTKELAIQYNQLGQELGISTLDVAKGALSWQRMGKSAIDTKELLALSSKVGTIANIDQAQSTEYLTSIMNGYKMGVDELSVSMDRLVMLDNLGASSVSEIADAMQRSSAVANDLGVDFTHLAATINTISSVTRLPSETIGTGVRSILTRMSNVKVGKNIDEEGEDISQVETVLKNMGIQLRDQTTHEFRDFNVILEETAQKWKQLGAQGRNVEQSQLANVFAGQKQVTLFRSLMDNQDMYNQSLKIESESLGTLNTRYKDYQNGLEGTQKTLDAIKESLYQKSGIDETLLGFNKLLITISQLTDEGNKFKAAYDWFFNPIGMTIWGKNTNLLAEYSKTDVAQTPKEKLLKEIEDKKNQISFTESMRGSLGEQNTTENVARQTKELNLMYDQLKRIDEITNTSNYSDKMDRQAEGLNKIASGAEKATFAYSDYIYQMDALSGANAKYDAILTSYADTQSLSADQVIQLSKLSSDYTKWITVEGDQIKLNAQAVRDHMIVKAQEQLNRAIELKALPEIINLLQTYVNQLKSGTESLKDSSKAQKDQEKSYQNILKDTIDMLKSKANAEKKALQDQLTGYKSIIDAQKKILDQQKQQADYQDQLNSANKEMSNIDNQMLALQFDTSQEAMAKKLELSDQKVKKQESIDTLERDHSIDIQKQGLDDEYDNYKSQIDAKTKALDDYLSHEGSIETQAIELLKNHWTQTIAELDAFEATSLTNHEQYLIDRANATIQYLTNIVNAAKNSLSAFDYSNLGGSQGFSGGTDMSAFMELESQASGYSVSGTGGGTPLPTGVYDSGGFVGLPQSDAFHQLVVAMNGEAMITPKMQDNFVNKVLPNMISSSNDNKSFNITIPMIVNGEPSKSSISQFKSDVTSVIVSVMRDMGQGRDNMVSQF